MSKSLKLFKLNKKLKERNNYLKNLEIKPLLDPNTLREDLSTINFIKRVGGQIFQFYALKDNLEIRCIPTFIVGKIGSEGPFLEIENSEDLVLTPDNFLIPIYLGGNNEK